MSYETKSLRYELKVLQQMYDNLKVEYEKEKLARESFKNAYYALFEEKDLKDKKEDETKEK